MSVSTSFARTRFSHFTPGLLLSTLSLHFLRVVFLFFLPLHVSISFSSLPSFCLLRRSTFSSFYARSPLFRRFPFFLTRRFFFLPNVTDALAFRTRSAGDGVVVRIITRTHPGYRRRLRRCVKLGNRFGTRNRGERRAGRLRGTVPRRTCISQSRHSLPGHGGNNSRGIFLAFR